MTKRDGRSKTAIYNVWSMMKQRCFNPKAPNFHRYGGRGIKVCTRWLRSFYAFAADMGPRPSPAHSIERKNNDKNYSPHNCIWVCGLQQLNTHRAVRITYRGETHPLRVWADNLGLSYNKLYLRIKKHGWSVERAFERSALWV